MNIQGYRTIIFAVLQFLVAMGILTTSEASQLVEGIMAVISLVVLIGTVYYRIKTKVSLKEDI